MTPGLRSSPGSDLTIPTLLPGSGSQSEGGAGSTAGMVSPALRYVVTTSLGTVNCKFPTGEF